MIGYFIFLLCLSVHVMAQKNSEEAATLSFLHNRKCKSFFTAKNIGIESVEAVLHFARLHATSSKMAESDFDLHYINESLAGKHYSFFQKIGEKKVYNSEVKINTDGKGSITSFFDNSFAPETFTHKSLPPSEAIYFLQKQFPDFQIVSIKEIWFPVSEKELVSAYQTELRNSMAQNLEVITDGNELFQIRDMNMYANPPDSTAQGYVFLPDPLTTSGNVYGGIYIDNNDADAPWLTQQRKPVNLLVNFTNNTFILINQFVKISDFDLPSNAPPTPSSPIFDYTRSNLHFEQVNAFYHITEIGKYIQSLGFNCANFPVEVDANALSGQDNSFFANNYQPMRLYFGTGGVDDAEDADVCVHEYSHFLSFNAAPQSNLGNERQALDEAFCDYHAASYSRWLNSFNWGRVYNWDGHNTFWSGRVVNSSKKYPVNLVNNIYLDGEIWSSMLMQLWGDIGRDVVDKLIVQAHYSYAQNIKFTDAAELFIQADQQLFNGVHYCTIAQRMFERGVLPVGKSLCANSVQMVREELPVTLLLTPEGCVISSAETIWQASLELFDVCGRSIVKMPFTDRNILYSRHYPAGMYLIKVYTPTHSKTLKWMNSQ
jgi:hypothetical protein